MYCPNCECNTEFQYYNIGSVICPACRKVFNKEHIKQMQPINVKQIGYEFKIELVPKFNQGNNFPIKADWYEIALSSGPFTMLIPIETFLKFSQVAKDLLAEEKRYE